MKKRILFFLFLLSSNFVEAQKNIGATLPLVDQARMRMNAGHFLYNPAEGFSLYKQAAEEGNAKAMNALGILYSEGIGTGANQTESYSWFKKATEAGYSRAWYNLALMQKNGKGTPQDYKKAYESYSKGAEINAYGCIYGKGVMHYKGLGCEQNYDKAFALFKTAVTQGSIGSMYMLGLCYRNGYGTAVNTDSARYWLSQAASKGYQFAKDELMANEAENTKQISAKSTKENNSKSAIPTVKQTSNYKSITHKRPEGDLSGTYEGILIKYDWSGKHVVSQSKVKLVLESTNSTFNGTWTENDSLFAELKGGVTDKALTFTGSAYQRTDHYHPLKSLLWEFRDTPIQLVHTPDSTYLLGNLRLYSPDTHEPGKPMYLSLSKITDVRKMGDTSESADLKLKSNKEAYGLNSDRLIAYPNPFTGSLNLSFSLEKDENVTVLLYDMAGKQVYSEQLKLSAGKHNRVIDPQIIPGSYALKLQSGNKIETTMIIKQ